MVLMTAQVHGISLKITSKLLIRGEASALIGGWGGEKFVENFVKTSGKWTSPGG